MTGDNFMDFDLEDEDDDWITRRMQAGVRLALFEHKRQGVPIVVWEDGKVKHIAAEDIPDHPTPEEVLASISQNPSVAAPANR